MLNTRILDELTSMAPKQEEDLPRSHAPRGNARRDAPRREKYANATSFTASEERM